MNLFSTCRCSQMVGKIKDEERLNRALCQPGAKVFYFDPNYAWAIGTVLEDTGKHFKVEGEIASASEVTDSSLTTCNKLGEDEIWPVREDVVDEQFDDLLNLTVLHDATIQRCLYIRYMDNIVYTNIGAIVVALNPWNFKIPHYMEDYMPRYLAEGEVIKENRPHSWAQAHNTYFELRRDNQNQCILISGESGAGKTEAAKIVMKYLGSVSCMTGSDEAKEAARRIAFSIEQASPILEGFGNAKTVRNPNSSRFGKFMKVQFASDGFLVGAFTIKYLLEKSRIVTASPGERVYHAFYLLVKGRDASKYGLGEPEAYHTNAGRCIDIPGVDDHEDYDICLSAMDNCGFAPEEKEGLWKSVAGIMHLLQVKFVAVDSDSCKVEPSTDPLVDAASDIWGTSASDMRVELVKTTTGSGDSQFVKLLTTEKAADVRDALVKSLYDQLFQWEVDAINKTTDIGTGENWIGLLDIFGFEDFEINTFEQICINLANETLQNHYNDFIFTKDMAECRGEGIDVTEVVRPDNLPCLNLLRSRTGVFGLLDDECSLGKGSDQQFLDKVKDTNGKNPFFSVKKFSKNSFMIAHYAATVNYTVEGWLDKNRDTLKPAMRLLMRASTVPFIAGLIEAPDENAKKDTVGGFFRKQLDSLMQLINSTNPHWIRCVKPHPNKKPLQVHGVQMMVQLESSGVLGTVKIRKAGFPVRPTFEKFIARFRVIVPPETHPALDADVKTKSEFCLSVCQAAGIEKLKAQSGLSKMFLKNEASQHLEAVRDKVLKERCNTLKQFAYYQLSISLVCYKRTVANFHANARTIQQKCRQWLLRSAEIREIREKERIERAKTLEMFAQKSQRAKLELDQHSSSWTVPSSVKAFSDTEVATIHETIQGMWDEGRPQTVRKDVTANNQMTSRNDVESLCGKLSELWFSKDGDVLTEWEQNLQSQFDVGSMLCELCEVVISPKVGDSTPSRHLLKLLLSLRDDDLNTVLFGTNNNSLCDEMLSNINSISTSTETIQKWVKTICLAVALSEPKPTPLDNFCSPAKFDMSSASERGDATTYIPTPVPQSQDGTLITGVGHVIDTSQVSPYSDSNFIIPPFSSFQIASSGEVTFKNSLGSSNVFLKELQPLALYDADCADKRLLKLREKLQQRKIEQERLRRVEEAKQLVEKMNKWTTVDEANARQQVIDDHKNGLADLNDTFYVMLDLFYDAGIQWICEAAEQYHTSIQNEEHTARQHMVRSCLKTRSAAETILVQSRESKIRYLISELEDLIFSEVLKRLSIYRREISCFKKLYPVVKEGWRQLESAAKVRSSRIKHRDKELRTLQKLRDDEFARLRMQFEERSQTSVHHPPNGDGVDLLNVMEPIGTAYSYQEGIHPSALFLTPQPASVPLPASVPQTPSSGSTRRDRSLRGENPYLRGMISSLNLNTPPRYTPGRSS
eukprot:TRINITY_DN868_c0_g1_i1.p1 TRINITY_DN868_c0_g1~~TRINITY_DN868_c0_g1_i1.p1  ORF type:complete len:1427 (+),score=281.74 TRINITY_DN868_c0_g1_i1:715-4995(+)